MLANEPYILWIASWYPNRFDGFNGDFIQRHARAVAQFTPIVLFHFAAPGPYIKVDVSEEDLTVMHNLKEYVCYTRFKPTGFKYWDKLRYHQAFYRAAKKRLLQFFETNGLPLGVHVHVPVKGGNIALWIRQKWNIPYIVSEHSSAYVPQVRDHFFTRHIVYRRQVRRIFTNAAAVTNVSRYIGAVLENLFSIKVQTLHNVVDTAHFCFVPDVPADRFVFLHVSTLDEVKNINGILNVFARLKALNEHWALVLIGPRSKALEQKIGALHLNSHVRITGMIPYQSVAVEMKKAHALVLFSMLENFPCVMIEALCCGLPVVSSAVAGVPEAVNVHNGILVQRNNETELLQALQTVMEQYDRFDRKSIAEAAAEKYSYTTVGRQIFNLYRNNFGIGQ